MAALCGCSEPATRFGDSSDCDLLLLGLEGSGKTLLVRRLQALLDREKASKFAADTVPTLGSELYDVQCSKHAPFKRLIIRELGGAMSPIWPDYFGGSSLCGVVFVVDLGDNASLAPATVELYELLHHPLLRDKHLLLVLNKGDSPITLSRAEVEMVMSLAELERAVQGRLSVVETSALTGHQVDAVMDWAVRRKCIELRLAVPRQGVGLSVVPTDDGGPIGLETPHISFVAGR